MKAKIMRVSKYGGLLLEGHSDKDWFNPPKENEEFKGHIYENFKKGDIVELEMQSERLFTSITKLENEPQEEPKVTEERIEEIYDQDEITPEGIELCYEQLQFKKDTSFNILNTKSVEIEKKGNLNYSSWAELWSELKKEYNDANFIIHEWNGVPYLKTEEGVFTKVSVSVNDITHTILLPVMDFKNQAIKNPDAMQINKTIMRNLAKAISLHGLGLYLYRGEDTNDN
jgi:hypothetical protein